MRDFTWRVTGGWRVRGRVKSFDTAHFIEGVANRRATGMRNAGPARVTNGRAVRETLQRARRISRSLSSAGQERQAHLQRSFSCKATLKCLEQIALPSQGGHKVAALELATPCALRKKRAHGERARDVQEMARELNVMLHNQDSDQRAHAASQSSPSECLCIARLFPWRFAAGGGAVQTVPTGARSLALDLPARVSRFSVTAPCRREPCFNCLAADPPFKSIHSLPILHGYPSSWAAVAGMKARAATIVIHV